MPEPELPVPERLNTRVTARGDWLELQHIEYRDPEGRVRGWESASRRGGRGAVAMVAHLRPSGRVLLVRQYRPPCDAPVIEFPAGLIDDGEEPADTAVRELREETGYTGTVRWISAPCPNSPGLSDEWARLAVMEVDETTDANRDPCQQCDEGEHIEVLRIPWSQAAAFLHQAVRDGNLVDGKVLCCFLHQLPGQTDEADVAAEPVTIHR